LGGGEGVERRDEWWRNWWAIKTEQSHTLVPIVFIFSSMSTVMGGVGEGGERIVEYEPAYREVSLVISLIQSSSGGGGGGGAERAAKNALRFAIGESRCGGW